jgi:hypothetical protein
MGSTIAWHRIHTTNNYTLGRIGSHHVAIACLPAGLMGVTSVARVAGQMRSTFTLLRLGLMLEISGGVPSKRKWHSTRRRGGQSADWHMGWVGTIRLTR